MKKIRMVLLRVALLFFVFFSLAGSGSANFVDLSGLVNHDGIYMLGKNYNNLPRNTILNSSHDQVPFRINQNAAGKIFVALRGAPGFESYPEAVTVNFQDFAAVIYFFGEIHINLANNLVIGKYIVRYADESTEEIPLDNDSSSPNWNTDDHCCNWRAKDLTKAYLAWEDASQAEKRTLIREFIWVNPNPGKKISSIDFVSNNTSVSPVLCGLTYQPPGPPRTVDLTGLVNHDGVYLLAKNYNNLPRNTMLASQHDNVGFKINQNAQGKIFVALKGGGSGFASYPESVTVNFQDFATLIYFFGHIHYAVANNQIIGKYVIRYSDASAVEILLDNDALSPDWNTDDHCCGWRAKDLPKAYLAWEDITQPEKRCLIREFIWANPNPAKKIASIEFLSLNTGVSPVLCAITYNRSLPGGVMVPPLPLLLLD